MAKPWMSQQSRSLRHPIRYELILVVEDDLGKRAVGAEVRAIGFGSLNGTEALILFGQNPDIALLFTDMVAGGWRAISSQRKSDA